MISSLNPSDQQYLNSLNNLADRMQTAQRQIATGVRLVHVSDDPDQVSTLLQARANLDAVQQAGSNLSRTKAEVDSAEQALQTSVQLFEQARTLGAQGASGTQSAASQGDLAQQVGSLLQELVGLAGTTAENRFVFSGDSDQQIPYTIDLTQASPVSAYLGTAATRVAQHPNGSTIPVSLTAQQIFDSADPTTNVFGSLLALRSALLANDETAIQTAIGALPKVGEYLNTQLANYGNIQSKVAEATDFGQNLTVQLQTRISGLQDADLTQSILELNSAEIEQQASLQSRARLPRTSLFDYLG